MHTPFYDPHRTYEDNLAQGPFGAFADGTKHESPGEPAHEYLTHRVHTPFGIAAGPLVNGRFVKAALDKGFDVAVYKTVRSAKHPSYRWPNIVPVAIDGHLTPDRAVREAFEMTDEFVHPLAVTNSFGVPSSDPDVWQPDMASAVTHAGRGQVVVGSFQGTPNAHHDIDAYIKDFARTAGLVKETGAKVLEANLSCPNEGTEHLLCFDMSRTRKVIEAIKNTIGDTPLTVKISVFTNPVSLEGLVSAIGHLVQGFSAINTVAAQVVTRHGRQALSGDGRLVSGVCGAPIKRAGLDMVGQLRDLRSRLNMNYAITGVGGVIAPEDFHEYRRAGADAVMSATGAIWNPYLAQEIKNSRDAMIINQ